ncbi:MAG: hypothetical protein ACFFB5_13920 [Promethearchaeota archaeon]
MSTINQEQDGDNMEGRKVLIVAEKSFRGLISSLIERKYYNNKYNIESTIIHPPNNNINFISEIKDYNKIVFLNYEVEENQANLIHENLIDKIHRTILYYYSNREYSKSGKILMEKFSKSTNISFFQSRIVERFTIHPKDKYDWYLSALAHIVDYANLEIDEETIKQALSLINIKALKRNQEYLDDPILYLAYLTKKDFTILKSIIEPIFIRPGASELISMKTRWHCSENLTKPYKVYINTILRKIPQKRQDELYPRNRMIIRSHRTLETRFWEDHQTAKIHFHHLSKIPDPKTWYFSTPSGYIVKNVNEFFIENQSGDNANSALQLKKRFLER